MEALQLTLTNRLRKAALDRAERGGRVVGTYVIDDEGVIDLRALEDRGPNTRASDPASLTSIAGQFGDAADVTSLYVADPVPGRKFFRRRTTEASTVLPEVLQPGEVRAVSSISDTGPAVSEASDETDISSATDIETDIAPESTSETESAPRTQVDPDTEAAAGDDDNLVIDLTELWSKPPADDPEPVIDLSDNRDPSSLQIAIAEFNELGPIGEAPERDIESGIRFGHGVAEPAFRQRPPLFGSKERSDVDSTAPPAASVPDSTETPDASGDDSSAGDTTGGDPSVGNTTGGDTTSASGPGPVCPMCGGAASRDFANRFLEIDFYSCGECFHMWHLTAGDENG